MERRGIICGGCWIVDCNNSISAWPKEETLAVIHSREIRGGGPSHNLSVDLARLGAPFPLWGMGVVGDDDGGACSSAPVPSTASTATGSASRPGSAPPTPMS